MHPIPLEKKRGIFKRKIPQKMNEFMEWSVLS
jgi:hypothetical protein